MRRSRFARRSSSVRLGCEPLEPRLLLATVSGRLWEDVDKDGLQDPAEINPLVGQEIGLFNASGQSVATTLSDAAGKYQFANVAPGAYHLRLLNLLGNLGPQNMGGDDALDSDFQLSPTRTEFFTLADNESTAVYDAGMIRFKMIHGRTWFDLDQNGLWSDAEPPAAGIVVSLVDALGNVVTHFNPATGNIVATATTNSVGDYLFPQLAIVGDFWLRFGAGDKWYTLRDQGTNEYRDSDVSPETRHVPRFTLDSIRWDKEASAGLIPLADSPISSDRFGGFVFEDVNYDGVREPEEPGLPDFEVTLVDASGVPLGTATTSPTGWYEFRSVAFAGAYQVLIKHPAGYVVSPAHKIVDYWIDSDFFPRTEPPLDVVQTEPFYLIPDQIVPWISAGFVVGGTVGGRVWDDVNANGLQDEGESGIEGVSLTLHELTRNTTSSTITDSDGRYEFGRLYPGRYVVAPTASGAGAFTPADQGDDDARDSDFYPDGQTAEINVVSGSLVATVDLGLVMPAAIGGFVWHDLNFDGVRQGHEPPLPDVSVTLRRANQYWLPLLTVLTDDEGAYRIAGLQAGYYEIYFTRPSGFSFFSPWNRGGDDALDSDVPGWLGMPIVVALAAGEAKLAVSAGLSPPARIVATVWDDANRNGVRDLGEVAAAGAQVTVKKTDRDFYYYDVHATDVRGEAAFNELAPGEYDLSFAAPYGVVFSPTDRGGDDLTDSDADPMTGRVSTILVGGEAETSIAAGVSGVPVDVDLAELARLRRLFGQSVHAGSTGDADRDGTVSRRDLVAVLALYPSPVVEPSPDAVVVGWEAALNRPNRPRIAPLAARAVDHVLGEATTTETPRARRFFRLSHAASDRAMRSRRAAPDRDLDWSLDVGLR